MITPRTDARPGRQPAVATRDSPTQGSAFAVSAPDFQSLPDAPRGPKLIRHALVLAVMVVVAVVGSFFAFRHDDRVASSSSVPDISTLGAEQEFVAEFKGNSDQRTKSFTVNEGWEIRWETHGQSLKVAISGDQNLGTVINQDGAGGGATYPVASGTYQLVITADGRWTITVINTRA